MNSRTSLVLDKLKKSIRKKRAFNPHTHDKHYQSKSGNGNEKEEGYRHQSRRNTWSSGNATYECKEIEHKEDTGSAENRKKDPGPVRLAKQDNVHINMPSERKSRTRSLPSNFSLKMKELTHRHAILSSRSSGFDAKSLIDFGTTNLKSLFNNKAKSMASILHGSQNSRQEAKWLARQLFNNMVKSNRDHLVKGDFEEFFASDEEAKQAFDVFDRDKNGDVTKRELRNGTLEIFRERKNLAASLRDLSQASGKLDNILMTAFAVVWGIIVCAAFGVDVGSQLLPLWTMFVAISFIFGNSAKDMFESIIFVFVTVSHLNL
jgi:hypothetical protein